MGQACGKLLVLEALGVILVLADDDHRRREERGDPGGGGPGVSASSSSASRSSTRSLAEAHIIGRDSKSGSTSSSSSSKSASRHVEEAILSEASSSSSSSSSSNSRGTSVSVDHSDGKKLPGAGTGLLTGNTVSASGSSSRIHDEDSHLLHEKSSQEKHSKKESQHVHVDVGGGKNDREEEARRRLRDEDHGHLHRRNGKEGSAPLGGFKSSGRSASASASSSHAGTGSDSSGRSGNDAEVGSDVGGGHVGGHGKTVSSGDHEAASSRKMTRDGNTASATNPDRGVRKLGGLRGTSSSSSGSVSEAASYGATGTLASTSSSSSSGAGSAERTSSSRVDHQEIVKATGREQIRELDEAAATHKNSKPALRSTTETSKSTSRKHESSKSNDRIEPYPNLASATTRTVTPSSAASAKAASGTSRRTMLDHDVALLDKSTSAPLSSSMRGAPSSTSSSHHHSQSRIHSGSRKLVNPFIQDLSHSSSGGTSHIGVGSAHPKRKAQEEEQALIDLTTCRKPESWRGCQPMSQWLVHNADPMVHGWRVLEVQFFSDRSCTNQLQWSTPLSAGFLSCGQQGQGYAPVHGMDNKEQTQWISKCGTESRDCDGIPGSPSVEERDMCKSFHNRYNGLTPSEANYRGTYIGATFASPQAVQCVRLLQAGRPYRSDRVTITSHNQNDCYICADGAMQLSDTFDDGLDTYIGTPGLKLEFFTSLHTWGNIAQKGIWPTSWEGVVKTDNLNVTTNSSAVSYPLSADPWRTGWPGPKTNYLGRWQGLLRILNEGPYMFLLQCDTEAKVFFDGNLVLQNNGSAGQMVGLYYEAETQMHLQAGVRYFELQYKHLYQESLNERHGVIFSYKGPDTIPTDTTTTTMGMPVPDRNDGAPATTLPPPDIFDIALWKVLPDAALMRGITDDTAVSNSVYIVDLKKHCHDIRYRIFGDRPAAQAACDADSTCGGIYGRDCNVQEDTFQGLFLCKLAPGQQRIVLGNSTENSCVFVKYDASETTTIPPLTAPPMADARSASALSAFAILLVFSGLFWG